MHVARATVYIGIDKALAMGVEAGLRDLYHRPRGPKIGDDAKLWVVNLACTKPKKLDYAAEVWSRRSLAAQVRKTCEDAGHPCLAQAGKATIQRILNERSLRPEKIRYYLERRDQQRVKRPSAETMVFTAAMIAFVLAIALAVNIE